MRSAAFGITTSIFLASMASAQVTRRASLGANSAEGNGASHYASVSADGRFVAFASGASNLVPGDTNGQYDIFVRARLTGAVERVSVGPLGAQADGGSLVPALSADGRYVAFWSVATNLVSGDTNAADDVFVHDRATGTTERVSLGASAVQANSVSDWPSISADGRYVAFHSFATNLVPGDTNLAADVFVRDRQSGTTVRASVGAGGVQGNGASYDATSISGDGRWVAFQCFASNLVVGDTNGVDDIFVHDLVTGTTERVSTGSSGVEGNSVSSWPSISGDGRHVAFESLASNLVPGDTNVSFDIFVHDRQTGATERASVATSGAQGSGNSFYPFIAPDGRAVAFESFADDLVPGDTSTADDVFLRDLQAGTTVRASVGSNGAQSNGNSEGAAVSSGGRFVAFTSIATNLAPGDANDAADVFVRDLRAAGFSKICEPGSAGVIACPCGNPAVGRGRGCDNTSGTGGARLTASGAAYLSADDLVFTTIDATPSALSITWQGKNEIAGGVVYGQGVRCTDGTLKRLFLKTTSGGAASAPDLAGGDPTVSARSAAIGQPIQPGEVRYYFAHYRDGIVPGGCPPASRFNATQTGRVEWSP